MPHGHVPAALAVALLALTALAGPATAQSGPQPAIVFDDQKTSGRVVIVDLVRAPEGGFVAIHDPSTASGDDLGDVLGSSVLLAAGQHNDVPITLQRNVTEPETLIAALYKDGNDNGVFDGGHGHTHDHPGNDPAYRDGNNTIGAQAEVQPYQLDENESPGLDPLVVGAGTAAVALAAWAARFR